MTLECCPAAKNWSPYTSDLTRLWAKLILLHSDETCPVIISSPFHFMSHLKADIPAPLAEDTTTRTPTRTLSIYGQPANSVKGILHREGWLEYLDDWEGSRGTMLGACKGHYWPPVFTGLSHISTWPALAPEDFHRNHQLPEWDPQLLNYTCILPHLICLTLSYLNDELWYHQPCLM